MDRIDAIKSLVKLDGFGLEIGPSFSPFFRKADGYNVETLDHSSADVLREHYTKLGMPIGHIEEVDYISDGSPLHEVIPRRKEYDFIFAAHVIEHVTDFLGFFLSCHEMLRPDGVVVLAVPDKRFCFDALQQISTTGSVLEAFRTGRKRHFPGKVFDHYANISVFDQEGGWHRDRRGELVFADCIERAADEFSKALDPQSPYIDVHGWQFTPSSFRLLIRDLNQLGLLPLYIDKIITFNNFEFVVSLSISGQIDARSRMEIMRDVYRELADGIDQNWRQPCNC